MFRSLYQVLSGAGHAATPAIRGTWVAAAMSVHMTVRRCSPLVFHTHVGKSNLCNNFKIISHARSVGKKKSGCLWRHYTRLVPQQHYAPSDPP